ncbi:serine/threonine-protein kinase [Streptomonospora wellingtoniae]|uniref:Serine/threonine-protein kinase n=1 Tax=Streptomonospora wellingtoniae TaxID=3075544 RepID=A0ABU2KSQ0_9ACTN|nr:serine/threonine-protein kinase [Streptomonospora sp. DSM 45055]MDT0302315.1 serine/threonine-protein kinase [Streptomonospora sp. DSM 45055]
MTATQPLTDDDPGRIGGYSLTARLGQGGQGVVYLGRDDSDGASVAVKTLHSDGIDAAGLRRQLGEEIETARRVARFCTAQVLAADIDSDPPYVVSEYIEGPTLREVVRRDGPVRGASLERLAVGTLTALAAIHQAGIVHRDFKPGNVLMGPDGPRVIDFGIARALEGTAILTSQIAGTPAYMAPEQIAGEALGPAVDLFSWGSTIAYAANGWSPFGQDSLHEVLHNVTAEPPNLGALDGRLREIAARCLAKDPAERPTAAETLMGVLGVAMADPAAAAPAAPEEPAAPAGEPGALPIHTLAAGAVAAAAPEARERTAAELRDNLPPGAEEPGGDEGVFRSFPPTAPPPGTGPQYRPGVQAATAAPSGPQTPPPPAGAPVGPGGDWAAPGSGAVSQPPHGASSGPQRPYPGGPAPTPPTGGQHPFGPGPGHSAPASGPQPPPAPGPGGPPGPPPGQQQPYGPGPATPPPSPYGPGAAAGPAGGQAPQGPGPQRPPGPGSGPQAPYGPGGAAPPPAPSGPQVPYAPGPGGPGSGPQAPAPYGPGGAAPQTGAQQPYGPAGPAPAKPAGGSGAGAIIGVVAGASLLVVVLVGVVIAVILS